MSDDRRWGERDRDWTRDRFRYQDDDIGRRDDRRWFGQHSPDRDFGDADDRGGGWPNAGPTYGYGREVAGGRTAYGRAEALRGAGEDERPSLFGDPEADRRRERERHAGGGPFRGRGPSGYRRSDERIREDVNDRLTDDSWLDASNIEVHVSHGEVTLAGAVGDRRDKRRAEDIAEHVSGVTHVQNNLRLRTASGGALASGHGHVETDMTGTPIPADTAGAHGAAVAGHAASGQATNPTGLAQGQSAGASSAQGLSARTVKETL